MKDNFWNERQVFVTGASGFIGAWLIKDLIKNGARVVTLIRDPDPQSEYFRSGDYQKTTIVQGMLEDYNTLERAISEFEPDTIFHLAAQALVEVGMRSPLHTFETNIRGTYNLLEACRMHKDIIQRVVIASSDKAYGTKHELPYKESMPLEGKYPYEVSKSCADLISQSYFHSYGLPVAIARCGNVYGGGDLNWSRIVPGAIRAAIQQNPLKIRSDGRYVRDYIYVKDVVAGYLKLAEKIDDEHVRGAAFNFGPGRGISVLDMIERIEDSMDQEIEKHILDIAEGEIFEQYLDPSNAKKVLDWQLRYSQDEGLRETISWYRDYFSKNKKSN